MRVPVYVAAILGAVGALATTLTGCGSEEARVTPGSTIDYGSFGTTASIDCANGKSLSVGGSNNTLKVKGTCASVTVTGADNTITLQRVDDHLSVEGLNNTVSYHAGDPSVDDSGTGNRINPR